MQVMDSPPSSGKLTVITGPSGVGKGSLVKGLLTLHPEIWLSVSATTRIPRVGEVEGQHYFFMTANHFEELAQKGGFVEWAEFAGNRYGTPREPIQKELDSHRPVLLEIELEGARQVRRSFPEAFQVFVAPPSLEELERRIRGRATDTEDAIHKRLSRAKEELIAQDEFDAVVINDDLGLAVKQLEELICLKSN